MEFHRRLNDYTKHKRLMHWYIPIHAHLHICIVVSISIVIFTIQCFSLKYIYIFIVNFVKKLNVVTKCKKPMTVVLPVVDISALISFPSPMLYARHPFIRSSLNSKLLSLLILGSFAVSRSVDTCNVTISSLSGSCACGVRT